MQAFGICHHPLCCLAPPITGAHHQAEFTCMLMERDCTTAWSGQVRRWNTSMFVLSPRLTCLAYLVADKCQPQAGICSHVHVGVRILFQTFYFLLMAFTLPSHIFLSLNAHPVFLFSYHTIKTIFLPFPPMFCSNSLPLFLL